MRRWLPTPLLSAALCAFWLLLNDSIAPTDLLLGVLLGVALPLLVAPLKPRGPAVRRPLLLARLILRVGGAVVLSAIDVATGVLMQPVRPPRTGFVTVPLDLRDTHGLAALAIITTVIPGSVWSELAPDRSAVRIHVFGLKDEASFIEHYKRDYELPLKEIFG
jgi:multicomponent K+:H+ antiporter subunit E